MCMTSESAKLSNTILFGAETEIDGTYHHVLGYQNRAEDLSGKPNCMILPIPAKNTLGPENIIDTRGFNQVLKLYAELFPKRTQARSVRMLYKSVSFDDSDSVQVFDSGSYTVVLSKNLDLISEALALVPDAKRPNIRAELLASLKKFYPDDWQYAFCCFDGTMEAEPLLWKYEPLNTAQLFLPALDAHDGDAPNMNRRVRLDHTVVVASHKVKESIKYNSKIDFYRRQDIPENVKSLFPPAYAGDTFDGTTKVNGDFWFDVNQIPNAMRKLVRATPPLHGNYRDNTYTLQMTRS